MVEAPHLLEQNIERLSWAADRAKSAKCWCPYSHSRRRPQERHAWSLSPHRPRKHITFQDQEEETSLREGPLGESWEHATGGGEVEECDLGPPPTLGPELTAIPNVGDPKKLAQKIHASFKILGVRCETLRNHKECTVPPVLKCVKWGMFLPNNLPYQDI